MRKRHSVLIVIFLLIFSNVLFFIPLDDLSPLGHASAAAPPAIEDATTYWNDNWTVDSDAIYRNQTIIVNGNLTVLGGFSLTLINVTLRMNNTGNMSTYIHVNNGATLSITDYDNDPMTVDDGCNITSNNTDGSHRFGFLAHQNSGITVTNSELSQIGHNMGSDDEMAIYIHTTNAVFRNSTISNGYRGIHIFEGSGSIIKNCRFHSLEGDTLLIHSASDMWIYNNTIEVDGTNVFGIYIQSDSWRNRIVGNAINVTGNNAEGIRDASSGRWNVIEQNMINLTGGGADGIRTFTAYTNITSNTIYAWDPAGDGIQLDFGGFINILNNVIIASGTNICGIQFGGVNNITLLNNEITVSQDNCRGMNLGFSAHDIFIDNITITVTSGINNQGIYFDDVYDIYITNSTIDGAQTDMILNSNSHVVTINSDFLTYGISDTLSDLTVQNYLDITVEDWMGLPQPGALIQIRNATSATVFSDFPDANGQIRFLPLTEVVDHQSASVFATPHNITVTASGYDPWTTEVTMDQGQNITAVLLPTGVTGAQRRGDWWIDTTEEYWNTTFLMDGNITINATGNLILHNITIMFNSTGFNSQYHINVTWGGELHVFDNDWDNNTKDDASTISDSPYDTDDGSPNDFAFSFYAWAGSVIEIRNSSVWDCGWASSNDWEQGIIVYADNSILDHVNISNRFKGIVIDNADNVRISNCTIWINASAIDAYGIHAYDGTGLIAQNNTITMTGTGANQVAIYLVDMTYSSIIGNTVTMSGSNGWGDGIGISGGTGNSVFENIAYEYIDGSGIVLWYTDTATVALNKVVSNSGWCTSIHSEDSPNSIIYENDVILNTNGVGIYLTGDCKNIVVYNNSILGNTNTVDGIDVFWAYNNFTIINSTITLTGTNSFGLHCHYSSYFEVYGLNVTLSDQFSVGLEFWYCDNITVIGANISSTSAATFSNGVWIEDAKDIFIVDLDVDLQNDVGAGVLLLDGANLIIILSADVLTNSASSPAVEGDGCYNIIFINSTLNGLSADDITLDQDAVVTLLNTTFSDRTVTGTLTRLIVGWYLNVKVQDTIGQPIPGVNVRVEHPDATLAYSGVTDSNGWIKWIPSLGYFQTAGGIDNSSNPHIINASNATCWDTVTTDLTNSGQSVTITFANDYPVIRNPISNIQLVEDSVGTRKFNADDKENNLLVWSINTTLSWVNLNSTTGKLTLSPTESDVGNHLFTIRVTDINSGYDEFNIAISVNNRAPVIQTINVLTATEDSLYSIDYDSDDDPATIWTLQNGPSWLTIDANLGMLSGTPNNAHVGAWKINISVEDGHGGITWNNFTLEVYNNPPTILTSGHLTATEDQLYQVDCSSSDDGLGTITWSLVTGPSWLSINTLTGVLSGTPNNAHVQQWPVTIKVSDGHGGMDQNSFTITVRNAPPIILNNDAHWVDEDSVYSVDYSSSDDGQGTITWSLNTDASVWLDIDAVTGILSGTPRNEHVGAYWVNVTVSDGNGGTGWHNFTLTVNNTNDVPIIITTDVLNTTEDMLYLVNYLASDDDGDILTWSLNTKANWLIIDASSGELSGTPGNLDVGIWKVTVSCDDGNGGIARHIFNLTVININDPPVIDYYSPPEMYPTVEEGLILNFNVTYSDEDSDTFIIVWTLDGLQVRDDVPFWSYNPDFGDAGDHVVIINITDDGGASVSQRWIAIVTFANRAPIIEEFGPMNLKPILESDSSEITFSVSATDPDSDQITYKWYVDSVDTGERASSFSFDRSSYGPGTYNLTVSITDDEGSTTEQTWTVDVKPVKKEVFDEMFPFIILLIIVIVVVVIIIVILFLKKKKIPESYIEDIFIISKAGILLAHKSREMKPDIDDDILSGMLTAIQDFVKDAFADKSKFGLKRLDFGDSEIRLKRGKGFYIAVVFSGAEPANLEEKLDKTAADIEIEYGDILENWTGNRNQVRGIKDHLDDLLK